MTNTEKNWIYNRIVKGFIDKYSERILNGEDCFSEAINETDMLWRSSKKKSSTLRTCLVDALEYLEKLAKLTEVGDVA